jgi:hypothetical protein
MKIRILKEIKGCWHTLEKNQGFELPFKIECKKTRRQMSLNFIESENDLWQDFGGFVSFSSSSHSNADGWAGSGRPLKHGVHFEVIDSISQKPIQESLL